MATAILTNHTHSMERAGKQGKNNNNYKNLEKKEHARLK